jgi:hypothetical protein
MSELQKQGLVERRELLHGIRMNWLHWLSTPIQLLWHVIVEAALAFWRLAKIAAGALNGSYDKEILKRSAIGSSVYFAVVLLFMYLAGLSDTPSLVPVGIALSLLPLAWTYGELTSVAKVREDTGSKPDPAAIPKGNGMRVASTMLLYVAIIIAALVIEVLISMLITVPGAGSMFTGIVLIPNVALSVIILLALLLLSFSILVLPSYLLDNEKPEGNILQRFLALNSRMLNTLKEHSYWIQILIIAPIAAVMAWIVALPMIALIFTSLGISTGLMGTVTAFSETAVESLQGLGLVISDAMDSMAHLPASIKIGMFIIVLAVSVISGIATSPFSAVWLPFTTGCIGSATKEKPGPLSCCCWQLLFSFCFYRELLRLY